ncbi:unnamed protein product [Musa acuminata subsp. malaccensis]|uniref:(wild Malaysian banana) hypothetical protein n=1 Tax=Musa acuminata subsp. malaccensis TaxID=214687 RepID=A0A804JWN8_MUSAM|nr:unnamed protein product [Musa acuminata subsp. malaccensis]
MEAQSLLFLALSVFVWSHAAEDNTRDLSLEDDRELERELKTLNKPFVKSFQDKYGITYDCVDIYKQPAFDHPLLKNHTLQVTYHLVLAFYVYLLFILFYWNTFTNFIS